MFDYYLLYYFIKKWVHYLYTKRMSSYVHLERLGTAAYTAAFVYAIQNGIDFNVFKLTLIGIIVIAVAERMKR